MKTSKNIVLFAFRRIFIPLLGAVALLLPSIGLAQETWTFDPTFQRTPLGVTSESAYAVKVLSSGKVLTYTINGSLMSGANGQRIGALVQIDPISGAIDPSWSADPTLTGAGFAGVAEAPDGKIYYSTTLIGDFPFTSTDPAVNRLIRLNTDGSRDTNFNSPIFAAAARFVSVQPDGRIIVCSGGVNSFGVPPAGSILHTVRLNTDGTLDPNFQSPVFQTNATDPPALDVGVFGNPVIDPTTNKIYFCGRFRFVNGQPRQAIVRCNSDGTLDFNFIPTGLRPNDIPFPRAMVLQTGGKVVLGGSNLRTAAGGLTRYALLRFNDDGTLDPAFTLFPTTNSSGTAFVPGYTGPRDIHTTPGGNILTSDIRVLRFLADGTPDPAFTPLDYTSPYFTNGVDGTVASFQFGVNQNTGAAYLANPYPLYARLGGVPVPGNITKLTSAGTIDTQFISPVVESEDFMPNVQIAPSGAVFVSGFHTNFGNAANATITRLLADGTRDATYSLGTLPFADKQAAEFALLPDNSAYVVYLSGSFSGGYQFSNLVRLLPTGAIDTSFHLSSALQMAFNINAFDGNTNFVNSLPQISVAQNGRAYLFGSGDPQETVNADGNLKLTRINADGTEDTSVPALGFPVGEVTRDASGITGGSTGYLNRLAQTADGGFIILASVAPFPTLTGAPYNYQVIKLRADGSRDPNFGSPSLASTVPAFHDFPFLFDPVTGNTTQPPNGFYRAGDFPITSAAMFPDGSVLLTGDFRLTGGSVTYSLAKLTPAGTLDSSFSPPVLENRARPTRPALLNNVRIAPGRKVWVLGRFDTIGGNPAPGVARLNPDGTLDSTFQLTDVGYYDSFGFADVVFTHGSTAYLVGTFSRPGESLPFAVTGIVGPPVIISPLTATGTVGIPLTYQFLASGATSLSVSNLPAGLTFDPMLAAIVGSPTQAGPFNVGLSASNANGTTNATLALTVQPPPASGPIITSGTAATGRPGRFFSLQVTTTGGSPAARVSATGLPAGLSIDAVTGIISGIPAAEGSSAVTLTVTDGASTTISTLQLTFTSDPALPVIISPGSAFLTPGQFFSYTITADASGTFGYIGNDGIAHHGPSSAGLPPGLSFDGVATISGVFSPLFGQPDLSGGIITNVQLFVTGPGGTSIIPFIFFPVATGAVNISTRLMVGTGDNVLIAGFIIQGNAPKKVLIRAIGPSLPVPGALQDTTLELRSGSGTLLASNDDWRSLQEQQIIDTTIPPTDNHESAILAYLEPGQYTAIVRGKDNTTGTSVAEVYDLGTASLDASSRARLANISTRGTVLIGDNVMIGGFIIRAATTRVIIRAIGPSLLAFGIPGALLDPTLQLRDGSGSLIFSNDDWRSTQEQEIIATGLAPTDNREAAIVATLAPGNYTAIVAGKNNTTGVALVETYSLGENLRILPQVHPLGPPAERSLGVSSNTPRPPPAQRVHRHDLRQEQFNRRSPRRNVSTE